MIKMLKKLNFTLKILFVIRWYNSERDMFQRVKQKISGMFTCHEQIKKNSL